MFGTPQEAAQAFLQHHQEKHGYVAGLGHASPPGDKEGGHALSSTIVGKKRKQPKAPPTPVAAYPDGLHQLLAAVSQCGGSASHSQAPC
jgi:hypothetical protein